METLRHFENNDLPLVLDFLNRNLEFDFISKGILEEKICGDPDFDQTLILEEFKADKLIGFIQGVIRTFRGVRVGYVKIFSVEKSERLNGIGRTLYTRLEQQLILRNVDLIRAFDVPFNYFMPGIDPRYTSALCFFEKMGFTRFGDTTNMVVNLMEQDFNVDAEIEKISQEHKMEIRRATDTDYQALLSLVHEKWLLWECEVKTAFACSPRAVFIAKKNNLVLAFSAYNGNNKGMGWFGPMGTREDLRGLGIGTALLKLCLEDLKISGLREAIIPWVGPIPFYSRFVNARIDRVFWRYQKIINPKVTL